MQYRCQTTLSPQLNHSLWVPTQVCRRRPLHTYVSPSSASQRTEFMHTLNVCVFIRLVDIAVVHVSRHRWYNTQTQHWYTLVIYNMYIHAHNIWSWCLQNTYKQFYSKPCDQYLLDVDRRSLAAVLHTLNLSQHPGGSLGGGAGSPGSSTTCTTSASCETHTHNGIKLLIQVDLTEL